MKRAFTLIELIITMVILSIVSYIASGLIVNTYKSYNQTNSMHKANQKAEIAITQIANRLEYAIDGTVVKRKSETQTDLAPIDQAPNDYTVLEWIGWDKDGFEANNIVNTINYKEKDTPAWSGFCNIKASGKNFIVTPGSDLEFAKDIVKRLSNDNVDFNASTTVAIFFPGNYDYTTVGYNGNPPSGLGLINNYNSAKNTLYFANNLQRITEHYKLAWSAYAIVPRNYDDTEKTFDLYLKYNFRPWKGEDYDTDGIYKLLVSNVTVFKTYATQNRIHIKLCVKERFSIKNSASVCREKVVFK